MGDYRTPIVQPTDAEITAFAEEKWASATSKEEVIATQKWLNFGLIQRNNFV